MKKHLLLLLILGLHLLSLGQEYTYEKILMNQVILRKYNGRIKKIEKIERTCRDTTCENNYMNWHAIFF